MNKYEAPEGKVYDWAVPHIVDGKYVHLYAKVIYLGKNDSITNYILVDEPEEIEE